LSKESQNEEQRSISCFFAVFAGSRSLSCHVNFHYGRVERYGRVVGLLEDVDANDKILGIVGDTRGAFSNRSGRALLDRFKRELEAAYCLFDAGPWKPP